jgi:tripartite-type tricarboxylate transporter receptor subunit TctC
MKKITWLLLVSPVTLGLILFAALPRGLADDFYEGKTIRVIVGFPAGGGYDTYTRAVARHMPKHIPGNPRMVVENMVGAGSLIAANYAYGKAKSDGLIIGNWNSAFTLYQALGDPAVKVDAQKAGWIGAPSKGSPHCSVMAFTGLKTFDDVLKSPKPIIMGANRAGSTYHDLPKLLNLLVGTKFDVITGYGGTADIRLAMQRKEVDGACWGWESARVTGRALLDAKGEDRLIPILNHRRWEDRDVKDVPLTRDVLKEKAGEEAVRLYDAWSGHYEFQRPLAVPPGTPKDRLQLLRKAFADTMEDSEFLAETKKAKLDIVYTSGEEIEEIVDKILAIPGSAKEKLRFLIPKS